MIPQTSRVHTLPFGKHKNRPLPEVPSDYLLWMARTCRLSTGLRAAVGAELAHRGLEVPSMPEPNPKIPLCARCGIESFAVCWQEVRSGERRIRAECMKCGRWLSWLPVAEPWIRQADANANPTALLDALTRLDELDARLESDGQTVWVHHRDWRRVPPDLHAIVRQCSHQLAKMIGRTIPVARLEEKKGTR
jgi:uncharacterized protein (DUF3820 family)